MKTQSDYLDLEISKESDTVLRNIERLIVGDIIDTKRNILAYAYGTNNNMILARRNLDSWGNIKSHCGFVKYAKDIKRYKNMTMMAASISEIEGMQATGRENKHREFED